MNFPGNKTKIVCTIGPASDSPEVLELMINAGLNVARLNFSHGDQDYHRTLIGRLRAASEATGRRIAIMGDLPGPKIRIGEVSDEPYELQPGDSFVLTTDEIHGDHRRVSVSFPPLPRVLHPGDALYLNDGLIQLKAEEIVGNDVRCLVVVGGEIRS